MSNPSLADLTTSQLRRIIEIKEKIEVLQSELEGVVGSSAGEPGRVKRGRKPGRPPGRAAVKKARRKISAAGRARMRAAAKARWQNAKASGRKTLGG